MKKRPAKPSAASRLAARRRKAEQRRRAKVSGMEQVSLIAPQVVMAKLRAIAPLYPGETIQEVLIDALTSFANQTQKGTQDMSTLAVTYWPQIRPLLPYLSRLASPHAPPIRVGTKIYTHEEVAPLIPVHQRLVEMAREQGHQDYMTFLDALVGRTR